MTVGAVEDEATLFSRTLPFSSGSYRYTDGETFVKEVKASDAETLGD